MDSIRSIPCTIGGQPCRRQRVMSDQCAGAAAVRANRWRAVFAVGRA